MFTFWAGRSLSSGSDPGTDQHLVQKYLQLSVSVCAACVQQRSQPSMHLCVKAESRYITITVRFKDRCSFKIYIDWSAQMLNQQVSLIVRKVFVWLNYSTVTKYSLWILLGSSSMKSCQSYLFSLSSITINTVFLLREWEGEVLLLTCVCVFMSVT